MNKESLKNIDDDKELLKYRAIGKRIKCGALAFMLLACFFFTITSIYLLYDLFVVQAGLEVLGLND